MANGDKRYEDVTIAQRVDTVDRELLAKGVEAIYVRTDTFTSGGESQTIHVFRSLSKGKEFGVWDTAQLGAKLRQVRPGAEVLIRYDGKEDHPSKPGKTVHTWTVKVAQSGPAITAATPDTELPF